MKKYFLLMALGMFLLSSCITDKDEPEWHLVAGDQLPRFEVTTLSGQRISSLDSYTSELVIIFFNTTCPDCRKELPLLQKQYEENQTLPAGDRSSYICISREEGAEDIVRFWGEMGLTLPVAPQDDRTIYSKFASSGIPRIFYARDGVITMEK